MKIKSKTPIPPLDVSEDQLVQVAGRTFLKDNKNVRLTNCEGFNAGDIISFELRLMGWANYELEVLGSFSKEGRSKKIFEIIKSHKGLKYFRYKIYTIKDSNGQLFVVQSCSIGNSSRWSEIVWKRMIKKQINRISKAITKYYERAAYLDSGEQITGKVHGKGSVQTEI